MQYFYEVFGKERVGQISLRYNLDLSRKYKYGQSLTRKECRLLFLGVGDVRKDDVDALFQKIQKGEIEPSFARTKVETLSRDFSHVRKVEDLSKEQMDELMDLLVPFEKIEDIFLQRVPRMGLFLNRSDSIEGRMHRVFFLEQMRRDPHFDDTAWTVRFMKRIADDRLPSGVMVSHPQGYFTTYGHINQGGCYKLLLKACTKKSEHFRSTIAYLSTRDMHRDVQSALDDIQPEIGVRGRDATFARTKQMLEDPNIGYVESPAEEVDVVGYSQGGANCQYDAISFFTRVAKITTINAVGIDKRAMDKFAELTSNSSHKKVVKHIADIDDFVPDIGDGHLGVFCDPNKVFVQYVALCLEGHIVEGDHIERCIAPRNLFEATYQLVIQSFLSAHPRETTALPHTRYQLDNQRNKAQVERILANHLDPRRHRWEKWRRLVAHTVDLPTLLPRLESLFPSLMGRGDLS